MQILWVEKSYTLPHAGVVVHSHPYFHMFYIHAGQGRFVINDKTYELSAGQTLLVPAQMSHSYSNPYDETMEYLEIKFTLSHLVIEKLHKSDSPLVGMLCQRILKEYSDLQGMADRSAAKYLDAIIEILTEDQRYNKHRQFRFIDASSFNELSQRVIRYLEEHYAEDISLDRLGELCGYHKSYLCVMFKKDTQTTIMDFLNLIRIRRAAELIVYSDHSLMQVADMCGFATVSHFNRVFAKYVGITPGQCRRAYPANVPHEPDNAGFSSDRPGRFMYSVLAQKCITPDMIRELGDKK